MTLIDSAAKSRAAGVRAAARLFMALGCCAALTSGCARVADIENDELNMPPPPSIEIPDQSAPRSFGAQQLGAAGPKAAVDSDSPRRPYRAQERIFESDRGALVAESATPRGATVSEEGDVSLNFADADVSEAARLIFGNILERNYLVSPGVTGRVTFRTAKPVRRDAVAKVFDAVLASIGATIVDRGDVVQIVPIEQGRAAGAPITYPGSDVPGYRVEIVPLSYVKASQMRPIIDAISGEGRVVAVDDARNIIVLAGTDRMLAPLEEAISLFDANWLKGMSFGVYPLENVAAETAVQDMEAIFSAETSAPALAVRFVPVNRINAVFVIAPETGTVREMIAWLKQLDQTAFSNEERIFVYFAQNTKATDLAATLNDVLSAESASSGSLLGGSGSNAAGSAADTAALLAAVADSRSPQGGAANGAAGAQAAQGGAEAPVSAPRAGVATSGGGVEVGNINREAIRVVAEETRNALLVAASPRDWRKIEAILNQLDVPPLQVLLEVTIAEVTLNDNLSYGLQWFFNKGNHDVTLSQASSGAVSGTFPGFSYVFSTNDIRVALDALSDLTDVNVISAPSLMVVNNETASLQVGDQVPIAVQSAVASTDPSAPIVNSIQFRDTGVILKVTPRVNNSGLVLAEIEQEVSSVVQTVTSGIDSPTIAQRRLSSTIAVQDGQAITLGGLIQDTRTRTKSGVPGISEVPFLGALFRGTRDDARRTELLVILTPRIVRDGSDVRAVTSELRSRLTRAREDRAGGDPSKL